MSEFRKFCIGAVFAVALAMLAYSFGSHAQVSSVEYIQRGTSVLTLMMFFGCVAVALHGDRK